MYNQGMYNQGIMIPGESPAMEGTWYNPNTGDSFVVRDSFFENDQYIVSTTDGRVLNYNQLQHYIKSNTPITNLNNQPNTQKSIIDNLPREVMDILGDMDSTQTPNTLGNIYNEKPADEYVTFTDVTLEPYNSKNNTHNTIISHDNIIIDKALSKRSMPDVDVKVRWGRFPISEINMLLDLMDIDKEQIVEWYLSKIDKEQIIEAFKNALKAYIDDHIKPIIPKIESTEPLNPSPVKALKTTKEKKSKKENKK